MKSLKRICTVVLILVIFCMFLSIGTSAADFTNDYQKRYVVGTGVEFDRYEPFDGGKGGMRCHFDTRLIDEAGIEVLHTTNKHYGTVVYGSNTNSTNVAEAGQWTDRYDVRVKNTGTAIYTAIY